ncbi:ABC transporter substrate-binding protein [Anaeromicropila populeti]|uniref:Carbohydrate ABC transporter substrate-binding protein, CUT1 family (TC 3.A.1.1.-) n=1 Tax=Anaeromicropila populeti TaxID=37658 RepID=A0A1I6I993_9FIRM|nr:ABC transporter substrate-binding protein [Anaeromicropila populeti]SFR63276.1 carbohydrate ABC transporter substrate-binding protein, CUT1 family (TC 3.A.1.1.-) [Anaeromicropila populeti]
MIKFKRATALLLALLMALSATACGKSDDESNTASEEPTASADTADQSEAPAADGETKEPVTIKFSWWGGDSRHAATQAAVEKFMEKYDWITVENQFGAWTGWEDSMSTAFASGTAPDVNQINWNWISSFSSDGSIFKDLNEYSNVIDLTQFDQAALDDCTVAGELQAIPVSKTGRIFYWNTATFEKAGIAAPTSLEELMAAGETFKTKLGEEYYPIALGEFDRMILMVYYLESKYGKEWVTDNTLNYTKEEIVDGMNFIQSLEDAHVTPSIQTITGDGAESLDKNPKWMDGRYAGIFEWDSSATKFRDALTDSSTFVVGDYFKDMGDYQGGYSKVSLGFAISETTEHPEECAMLINFLVNEDEGIELGASERGIPLSKYALQYTTDKGLLDATVSEANAKVLAWTSFKLDPKFEDAALKSQPDGVYYDVFAGLSYGDYNADEAADTLIEGVNTVLGN